MDYRNFMNEKFGEVRVVVIKGKNWFIGKDIVTALGYNLESHSYTKYINKYVSPKGQLILNKETQSQFGLEFNYKELGQRGGILLNEGGVNQLSLNSPLPDALEFSEWICYEVLPMLNHTGGYVVEGNEEEFINKYFPSFSDEVKVSMVQDLLKQNKELKGKACWFDNFINSNGAYTSTQVAKLFKISSAQKINQILNEKHLIFKQGKSWLPYADVNAEWFKVTVGENNGHNYSTLKFTPLGIVEISKILNIDVKEEDLKNLMQ